MSEPTKTMWSTIGAVFGTQDGMDVICVTVAADGKQYSVSIAGPEGMKAQGFIGAARAATAVLLQAVGADMKLVGAMTLEDSEFDTGDQRAN
jgi:hypothetical protein